jgi:hypothetical protein
MEKKGSEIVNLKHAIPVSASSCSGILCDGSYCGQLTYLGCFILGMVIHHLYREFVESDRRTPDIETSGHVAARAFQ